MADQLQLQNAEQQFFDDDGTPLALGTAEFFIPGTLTHKTTYQDEGGTIPNLNPIPLDAAGRAIIWGIGLYRQIVKRADGTTVWDQVTGSVLNPATIAAIPAAVQNGSWTSADDTGVANAYAIAISPIPSNYTKYQRFSFKALNSNTGPSTLNVNGQGAISIVYPGGGALASGAILAGAVYQVVYDGSVFELAGGQVGTTGSAGLKNRLFNGAVMIDQRHSTSVVTLSATLQYGPDKWKARRGASGAATLQRSVGGGPGGQFPDCLAYTVTTGAIPGATDQAIIEQDIEGLFFYDAQFGSANGQTISLSFWMNAPTTGNYAGALQNSAQNRSYPFTFPVNATGWGFHSVVIPADIAGTWLGATTGIGLRLIFDLGSGANFEGTANTWQAGNFTRVAGSASPIATSGAVISLTGAQLEIAATPSAFDLRAYDQELRHCMRYYEPVPGSGASPGYGMTGFRSSTTIIYAPWIFAVTKRAAPTLASSTPTWSSGADPTTGNAISFFDAVAGFATITGALSVAVSHPTLGATLLALTAASSFSGSAGSPGFLTVGAAVMMGADADF